MNADEQSVSDHLNTFFTPFNNAAGATLESNIAKTQELGGICHINHPGRYYGGKNTSGTAGEEAANNPANIKKYVEMCIRDRYGTLPLPVFVRHAKIIREKPRQGSGFIRADRSFKAFIAVFESHFYLI